MEDVTENKQGRWRIARIVKYCAIFLSVFQLWTMAFGIFRSPMAHRAAHLGLTLVIYFLASAIERKSKAAVGLDLLCTLLAAFTAVYFIVNDMRLNALVGLGQPSVLDLLVGGCIILLVLEAIRRTQFAIFICCLAGLLYMLFGQHLPGILQHPGINWRRTIYYIGMSGEGIYGSMINVSSTFLFGFILLGAFLVKTGIIKFFLDSAALLFGRFTGGTAKLALFGSGLLGTVMGSGLANVATTGVFTIPMMKKSGLKSEFAGAVECVASDGGQILPPVMGTAAFLMAEFTGIPYATIAIGAFVPALLYYLGCFCGIHFYTKKTHNKGMDMADIPKGRAVLKKLYYALPMASLAVAIFALRMTATKAALVGIISSIIVTFIPFKTHISFKDFLNALEEGAKGAIDIIVLCAGIGIFVGCLTTTGLAMRFSEIMMAVSGGNVLIMLIIAMVTAMLLGCGIPTPAAYMIAAAFIAPPLVSAGLPLLAVHLFLFHFAIKASITPPVAVSAVVAAGIADTKDWVKTCWYALRLAAASFIVPYMFVFGPGLLLQGNWLTIAQAVLSACIGVTALAAAIEGYLFCNIPIWGRILMGASGILLAHQGTLTDIIGISCIAVVAIHNFLLYRKTKASVLQNGSVVPAQDEGTG